MKYSIKKLASEYIDFLCENDFDVPIDISQPFDIKTYNDYKYLKLIKQFDLLYSYTDSFDTTEKFLKGD